MNRKPLYLLLISASLTQTGCSLIFGGDQRVDNRSHDYTVVRLDHERDAGWHILAPEEPKSSKSQAHSGATQAPTPDDTGDLAFEHKKTGTIISVHSVCNEYRDASLEELSKYLLMGLSTRGSVSSREIELDGTKGLDSTVEAAMSSRSPGAESKSDRPVKVRTVVLKKRGCVYDLMYVAHPDEYARFEPTFERFLKGFHAE